MCFLRISHFFLAADDDAKWQPICQKIYDHTKWQAAVLPLLPDAPWIMQWNLFHFSHLRARAHENFLGVSRLSTDFCYCYKWGRNDSLIYENVAYFSYAPNTLGDFFLWRGVQNLPPAHWHLDIRRVSHSWHGPLSPAAFVACLFFHLLVCVLQIFAYEARFRHFLWLIPFILFLLLLLLLAATQLSPIFHFPLLSFIRCSVNARFLRTT